MNSICCCSSWRILFPDAVGGLKLQDFMLDICFLMNFFLWSCASVLSWISSRRQQRVCLYLCKVPSLPGATLSTSKTTYNGGFWSARAYELCARRGYYVQILVNQWFLESWWQFWIFFEVSIKFITKVRVTFDLNCFELLSSNPCKSVISWILMAGVNFFEVSIKFITQVRVKFDLNCF